MATIAINDNITFTASEDTIAEYQQIQKEIENCNRGLNASFEERDWEDYMDYSDMLGDIYDRLHNLGGH